MVGIIVAIIVVFAAAGTSAAAWKGKFTKKEEKEKMDDEKGAIEGEADKTSQTESAHDDTKVDESKTDAKESFSLQTRITTFFSALKPKQNKMNFTKSNGTITYQLMSYNKMY